VGLILVAALAAAAAVGLSRWGTSPAVPSVSSTAKPVTAAPVAPLLGIVRERQRQELARIDPATMRAKGGRRVGVGSEGCASSAGGSACWSIPPWSFSPDRRLLALARHDRGAPRSLRIVDVRRMRVTADLPLDGGAVGSLAWPVPERLLMVQEVCCEERQQLVVVDLARRRAVARRPLDGTIQRLGRTARELVLLLSPAKDVGPARLAIADVRGRLRSVLLERVQAGVRLVSATEHRVQLNVPGLAVDPTGRLAYVVGPGVVAEVDLASLRVAYHDLKPSASVLARLLEWLEPPAHAKGASGPTRSARWLTGGLLAVAGSDEEFVGEQNRVRAAGLSLVDTRDWSVRTIDRDAADVRVAGDVLLATGSSWEPGASKPDAIGLVAYGFDGRRRFGLLRGREVWVRHVVANRAYVDVAGSSRSGFSLRVIDLRSGRPTRDFRAQTIPWLLLERAYGRWDG
jgi:hypothetical protein